MKIALCFSGNIRFLQECHPDIKKYLIDNNDVDIYAHLWWDSSYKGKIFRFHSADRFEDRDLDLEFIELYKPKDYIIEIQQKFMDVYVGSNMEIYGNEISNALLGQTGFFNQMSQYYSKMKANELCEKSGIKYDVIVHLRTDCVIDSGRFLKDTLNKVDSKNQLYMVSTMHGGPKYCGHHPNLPSDWFFVGEPKKMQLFTKSLYELLYVYIKYKSIHIQDYLITVLNHIQLPVLLIDSGTSVYRPNTMFRGSNLFVEPENYFNNFDFEKKEWKDINHPCLPYYTKFINFKENHCILCGKTQFDIYQNCIRKYKTEIYRIIQCKSCNHIQLFPNNYDVKHYYDDDLQDCEAIHISNRDNIEWHNMVKNQAYRRITILEKIYDLNSKKIIDIGGGYGDFVQQISEKYMDSHITLLEPGISRIHTKSIPNLVKINQFMDNTFASENKEKYDIITSFHVLEHVINPKEFIKNCYTITKPGGLIYIEVPNQDNDVKDSSEYYRDNIWYMKAHISYFTVDIMKQILKELDINNYSIHGFERYDYENYLNWIQNNKPQAKCTYYTGIPKSEEEKIWIEERERKLITDSFYLFIKKDE